MYAQEKETWRQSQTVKYPQLYFFKIDIWKALKIDPVVPLDVLLLEPLLVDDLERLRGKFTYDIYTEGEWAGPNAVSTDSNRMVEYADREGSKSRQHLRM